ncbi:MAG: S41 family peptidase [Chitinophagaceae bacterium]
MKEANEIRKLNAKTKNRKWLFLVIPIFFFVSFTYCQAQKLSSPEKNFEFFWNTFNKYYPNFKIRKVDWQEQYKKYRPLVTKNTTDDELFNLLNEMVTPLRDGHIAISKTGDLPASAKYSSFHQQFPTKDSVNQLRAVIVENLSSLGFADFIKFNSTFPIGGFSTSEQYGYLQLNGFGGMPLKAFEKQLDEMGLRFKNKKAVIIDIRINGGGEPAFVNAVVARFSFEITGFDKPITLLTSGASISAADHFAVNLMDFPNVTIIGERTAGMFSSMMGKKMPNGWEFSLSHETHLAKDGNNYEGVGIPVDIEIANTKNNLATRNDPVLNKAFDFLKNK